MDEDVPSPKRRRTLTSTSSDDEASTLGLGVTHIVPKDGDSLCGLLNQANNLIALGEFEISRKSRFEFDDAVQDVESLVKTGHPVALSDLLELPVYDVVSDRHRIAVALTLVKAVLKFHSTRCWPEGCLMSQVQFYTERDDDPDLAACLHTLHLTADMSTPDLEMDAGMAAGKANNRLSKEDIRHAKEAFGIENMLLYCVGVALLQIGIWDTVPWKDVITVRRRMGRLSFLGEKYHRVTKKLVNCNFESASSLSNENLQAAIIDEVIFVLQTMSDDLAKEVEPRSWPEAGPSSFSAPIMT